MAPTCFAATNTPAEPVTRRPSRDARCPRCTLVDQDSCGLHRARQGDRVPLAHVERGGHERIGWRLLCQDPCHALQVGLDGMRRAPVLLLAKHG
jgi:hypothetical protein